MWLTLGEQGKKIQNGGSAPFLFIDLFNKGLMKTYINIP
jgi:hypothetical protein